MKIKFLKINLFLNHNKKMPAYLLLFTLLFSADDPVLISIFDEAIKRGVPKEYLEKTFNKENIIVHEKIPEFFAKPYEKKSWGVYKKIFVTPRRIESGIKFYNQYGGDLRKTISKNNDKSQEDMSKKGIDAYKCDNCGCWSPGEKCNNKKCSKEQS